MYRKIHILVVSVVFFCILFFPSFVKAEDLIATWVDEESLLLPTANHHSYSYLNYIYTIGGSELDDYSHVEMLDVRDPQEYRSWIYVQELSEPRYWFAAADKINNFYIIAGTQFPNGIQTSTDKVTKLEIGSDGQILSESEMIALPNRVSEGAATVYENYIYFSGGWTDSRSEGNAYKSVFFSKINNDGSISDWTHTSELPEKLWGHSMFASGEYVYVVGGQNASGVKSSIYKSKINLEHGSLGNWEFVSNLPMALRDFSLTIVDNIIFVIGGRQSSASSLTDKVYYSTLDNLNLWQTSASNIPQKHCCGSSSVADGYLYIIGGKTDSPQIYTSKVYKSKIYPDQETEYISLPVPDLKQYEGGWENDIYDHTLQTIKNLGCALTSAAMILQYHGSGVSPAGLNNWLKSQPDGFLRNGLVNWLAISRYSLPHLEYLRIDPTGENILNELENQRPGIVKVPGHFVVYKGQTESSFEINDPGYPDRNTLESYPEKITLNTFTPSETDLSYMMFAGDENLIFNLLDENGNEILSAQKFIETPINGEGESLSIFLFSKPQNGNYKLEVFGGTGNYRLDTYLYGKQGNLTNKSFDGIIYGSEKDIYPINFNSENSISTSFEQILKKLNLAYKNKDIKHKRIYFQLKRQIEIAQKYYTYKRVRISKLILGQVRKQINWLTPYFINRQFAQTFSSSLSSLISSL